MKITYYEPLNTNQLTYINKKNNNLVSLSIDIISKSFLETQICFSTFFPIPNCIERHYNIFIKLQNQLIIYSQNSYNNSQSCNPSKMQIPPLALFIIQLYHDNKDANIYIGRFKYITKNRMHQIYLALSTMPKIKEVFVNEFFFTHQPGLKIYGYLFNGNMITVFFKNGIRKDG